MSMLLRILNCKNQRDIALIKWVKIAPSSRVISRHRLMFEEEDWTYFVLCRARMIFSEWRRWGALQQQPGHHGHIEMWLLERAVLKRVCQLWGRSRMKRQARCYCGMITSSRPVYLILYTSWCFAHFSSQWVVSVITRRMYIGCLWIWTLWNRD